MQEERARTQVQKEAAKQTGSIGLPDQAVINFVWKVIAVSLSIVFVGCFIAIAFSVVHSVVNPQKTPPDAGLQTLQTIFALIVGLISGVFLSKPTNKT